MPQLIRTAIMLVAMSACRRAQAPVQFDQSVTISPLMTGIEVCARAGAHACRLLMAGRDGAVRVSPEFSAPASVDCTHVFDAAMRACVRDGIIPGQTEEETRRNLACLASRGLIQPEYMVEAAGGRDTPGAVILQCAEGRYQGEFVGGVLPF